MSGYPAGEPRTRIEFAEEAQDPSRIPLKFRLSFAVESALLFVVRWGLAIVLLGVVARLTLTEVLVPPIYRLVREDLAEAVKKSDEASKGATQAVGFLNLLIERGVLPQVQDAGKLPKAEWSQPFVLKSTEKIELTQAPVPEAIK